MKATLPWDQLAYMARQSMEAHNPKDPIDLYRQAAALFVSDDGFFSLQATSSSWTLLTWCDAEAEGSGVVGLPMDPLARLLATRTGGDVTIETDGTSALITTQGAGWTLPLVAAMSAYPPPSDFISEAITAPRADLTAAIKSVLYSAGTKDAFNAVHITPTQVMSANDFRCHVETTETGLALTLPTAVAKGLAATLDRYASRYQAATVDVSETDLAWQFEMPGLRATVPKIQTVLNDLYDLYVTKAMSLPYEVPIDAAALRSTVRQAQVASDRGLVSLKVEPTRLTVTCENERTGSTAKASMAIEVDLGSVTAVEAKVFGPHMVDALTHLGDDVRLQLPATGGKVAALANGDGTAILVQVQA